MTPAALPAGLNCARFSLAGEAIAREPDEAAEETLAGRRADRLDAGCTTGGGEGV